MIRILALSGSLRAGSSNTALLVAALGRPVPFRRPMAENEADPRQEVGYPRMEQPR